MKTFTQFVEGIGGNLKGLKETPIPTPVPSQNQAPVQPQDNSPLAQFRRLQQQAGVANSPAHASTGAKTPEEIEAGMGGNVGAAIPGQTLTQQQPIQQPQVPGQPKKPIVPGRLVGQQQGPPPKMMKRSRK